MSDGSRLRQSWSTALSDAETHFRQLLTSPSNEWRRVSNSGDSSSSKKGKAKAPAIPELTDVVVHRKPSKAGDDIYRLVLDVPFSEELSSMEPWKAVLTTPELRQEWDPAVDEAHLLETFDHTTRIAKTNFTLGWPASPRDAVTISRSYHDATTVIDITTSLPRSVDEPAYLRPSPPFVRSHIPLFAWCIQLLQPQPATTLANDTLKKKVSSGGKIRMTCFWQHDLKALWGFGTSSNLTQQLSTMTLGLLKTVLKRGSHVPRLIGYGNGVSIEQLRFQVDREALTIDYAIIPEDEATPVDGVHGIHDVHMLREQRRLTRSIECLLPSSEGWDVRVTTKASSEQVEQLPWTAHAIRSNSFSNSSQSSIPPDHIVLRLSHAALIDDHSVLKVRVVIEISGPSSGLRLNGIPQTIQDMEQRDPSSYFISPQILQDVSSAIDLSFKSTSSFGTTNSSSSVAESADTLPRAVTERSPAADKSVLSRVRRNYIYFSSLLQEPEAKWRRTTDGRGVSITQLDSIDPTLVVYRAEATFVGVGLWDLFGAVVSPGAKIYWDKQHEDAVMLEDVNELTELWHFKTRPAWPVNGRDAVVLKTVYKSPTAIHVFSFSAEDPNLFPAIPPVEPNVIRTQVDLQGWAIEALSPTTTQLTLLEQSDPKGWTNKTSIPTQMINLLAGIGEFAIKCGGPPIVTRLAGAKANELRYEHERSSFRIEYEASASRRAVVKSTSDSNEESGRSPIIECELRCDLDTWAQSLDIVVDPPPQTVTCLRRHRLSAEGGGLWITLTHDAMFVDEDRLLCIVRRAPGKEKGLVMINGAKVQVDVEELPEAEIKVLQKQKRVKLPRIPLDQPPVMGAIRKRRAEWDADSKDTQGKVSVNTTNSLSSWASAPRISSPLTRFFNYAVDQATTTTQQAVAAISPAVALGNTVPSPLKAPMQYALDALAWTQETHARFPSTGWELVSEKGLSVHRKLAPEICSVIPVHKGFKVIEGVSAEELAAVITEPECQRKWDDRYDTSFILESFGGRARTSFVVSKAGFPWRDRGFYVASVMARAFAPPSSSRRNTSAGEVAEQSNGVRNAVFCVSASFSPDSVSQFSSGKYNSYVLPIGRVYIDAWILETLDPYTKENYAIPSTRCTRLVAVDYAGSIPAVVNSTINAGLPRAILALEAYVKGIKAPHPVTRLPVPGLVITDKKLEGYVQSTAWKLRRRDEERVLVGTRWDESERVYVVTILVRPSWGDGRKSLVLPNLESKEKGKEEVEGAVQLTPRPGKMQLEGSVSAPSVTTEYSSSLRPEDTSAIASSPPTSPDILLTPRPSNLSPPPSIPISSTSPPAPPPPHRQRSASSSSPPTSNTSSYIRGRTTSSAFTNKGEVRTLSDLVVGEVVVDSKLYPDGYDVLLRSRFCSAWRATTSSDEGGRGIRRVCVPLRGLPFAFVETSNSLGISTSTTTGTSTTTTTTATGDVLSQSDPSTSSVLPLAYTIHTMPSSPLHSSGLADEGSSPTRHLLRLTLPTAQYQVSAVRDPLTGEMRGPGPRPSWYEEVMEGGGVVEVEVRPRRVGGGGVGVGAGTGMGTGSLRGKGKGKEREGGGKVWVDGREVGVKGEKESLSALGREELLDDRVAKMGVLSRIPSESEPLPDELKLPVGIADELLDPAYGRSSTLTEGTPPVNANADNVSGEEGKNVDGAKEQEVDCSVGGSSSSGSSTLTPRVGHVAGGGGLLGLWNAYNNPLTLFSAGAAATNTSTSTNTAAEDKKKKMIATTEKEDTTSNGNSDTKPRTAEKSKDGSEGVVVESGGRRREFGLSTVLVVAVIAFLIGSLLRSLVSPADFIYFVTDGVEEESGGWREMRRLVEVKYVLGGWDLQVAVVRRH